MDQDNMRKVKAFPYLFCESCMLNGCYPWNNIIIVCCGHFGGILPMIIEADEETGLPTRCHDYKPVNDELWNKYLEEKKKEAKDYEESRRQAMDGIVWTNQTLPEHIFIDRVKKNEMQQSHKKGD